MPSLLIVFFMIIFLLESMASIIENSFIVIVLGREWVQYWTLPPGDMILLSLGISRFFLQWAAVLTDFYAYFSPSNFGLHTFIYWNFANMTTLWFATWLAVFYCVKISSFIHPVFLWLKWRISRFVPWLLLCSLLLSTLICVSSFVKGYHIFQLPVTGNYSETTTVNARRRAFRRHFFQPLQMFMLLIPFLIFLLSIILLISSLCQHLGNMKHHSAGLQDPRMQVHITALKSLFFFLIIYISRVIPVIITTIVPISVFGFHFWVLEAVTYVGMSIHPAFLILNSSKLRRALKKMIPDSEAA
ncbi:taste receptor type 2 member 134-like [Notamacropus eugenii]|uniref:taste receptor type 2 member 134-like n=1 Tax=Notamacropus eugenii TaxID=9315 RepID=UPI003B66CBC2